MAGFPTLKGLWPWRWPWIWPHCIPSCIDLYLNVKFHYNRRNFLWTDGRCPSMDALTDSDAGKICRRTRKSCFLEYVAPKFAGALFDRTLWTFTNPATSRGLKQQYSCEYRFIRVGGTEYEEGTGFRYWFHFCLDVDKTLRPCSDSWLSFVVVFSDLVVFFVQFFYKTRCCRSYRNSCTTWILDVFVASSQPPSRAVSTSTYLLPGQTFCFTVESAVKQNVWPDNKYVDPPYCRTEMYAGRVVCCPLVSHGDYANLTDKQTDRRTDARPLQYAFR